MHHLFVNGDGEYVSICVYLCTRRKSRWYRAGLKVHESIHCRAFCFKSFYSSYFFLRSPFSISNCVLCVHYAVLLARNLWFMVILYLSSNIYIKNKTNIFGLVGHNMLTLLKATDHNAAVWQMSLQFFSVLFSVSTACELSEDVLQNPHSVLVILLMPEFVVLYWITILAAVAVIMRLSNLKSFLFI